MSGSLRILFPLALAALLLPLLGPPEAAYRARYRSGVSVGEARAAMARWPQGDPQQGYVRARTMAEQLRTGIAASELAQFEHEFEVAVAALAQAVDAASLPWGEWIEEAVSSGAPLLARELFVAARTVLPWAGLVELAEQLDRRTVPQALRVEVHRVFWDHDGDLGYNRTRRLVLREEPRANETLRARLVTEILWEEDHPRAGELLIEILSAPRISELARRRAVRALGERGAREAAASLESLFDSEDRNLLLRQEALNALIRVHPARGAEVLRTKVPDSRYNPGLYEFFRLKREELGMDPLPRGVFE